MAILIKETCTRQISYSMRRAALARRWLTQTRSATPASITTTRGGRIICGQETTDRQWAASSSKTQYTMD